MDAVRHALLASSLLQACGGPTTAAEHCRLEMTRLYEFMDPRSGAFMPADVIADLEAYCGEPLYSRALVENRPASLETQGLVDEASSTTELVASLQALVRRATADGRIDHGERLAIQRLVELVDDQVRKVRAAAAAGEATQP